MLTSSFPTEEQVKAMYAIHKYVCPDGTPIYYCMGDRQHAPPDVKTDWWQGRSITGPTWRKTVWIGQKNISTPVGETYIPPYRQSVITLWWNGMRWMVWIEGLYRAEPSDFTNVKEPPLQWAEGIYALFS